MIQGPSKLLGALLFVLLLTPSFVAAATFERPLFLDSVGPDVSALQQILMDRGVYRYPSITGFFGQVTFQAVADFQRSVGLDPLGYVGPATRALLNSGTLPAPLPAVLALGSVGPDVSALQILLRDAGFFTYPTITTYFGPVTQAALMAYQQATGSAVTGTYTSGTSITTPSGTGSTPTQPVRRSGGSRKSGSDDVVEVADTTGPVLSGISATPSQTSATIEWITDEAADTQVAYGTDSSYGATTTIDTMLVTSHSVSLSGLTAATTYHYRVYSRDASGNLTASSDQTFTTSAVPDTTGPVFSSITASSSQTTAIITWNTNEASDSQVAYGTTLSYGATTTLDAALVTSHSVALSGLVASTTYHYRVYSHDASGNLTASSDQTFTTTALPDTTGPTFSGIYADPTDTTVSITWDTNEAATSRLEYGTTVSYGTFSALDATLETDHTISLSGLTESTQYYYRVISTDAAGNTSTSTGQTFTTDSWVAQDEYGNLAYIDMRLDDSQYWFDETEYGNQASFLSAAAGVATSSAFIFGPIITGSERLANANFDTDVAGWTAAPGWGANLSWAAPGRLVNSYSVGGQTRFNANATTTSGRAYRLQGTLVSTNSSSAQIGANPAGGGSYGSVNLAAATKPASDTVYFGAVASATAVGAISNPSSAGTDVWESFSVYEAQPFTEWSSNGYSFRMTATTAASDPVATQVLFAADPDSIGQLAGVGRNRVRVVWGTDKHLRVIVTTNNTEQANLDLGVVNTSTAFEVNVSIANNDIRAVLDGGTVVADGSATMPGAARVWLGRSYANETWGGTITSFSLWQNTQSLGNVRGIAAYGDSTAAGSGGTPDWYTNLLGGYSPSRLGYRNATGGQSSYTMLTTVLADTTHRNWLTIFMDRPNTGEVVSDYINNIKSSVAHLTTNEWFVMPPAQNVPSTSLANITGVQEELLSDSFFSGHTLGSSAQAAYLSDVSGAETRSDGLHFNAAGQAIQANYIRAFLDAQGW